MKNIVFSSRRAASSLLLRAAACLALFGLANTGHAQRLTVPKAPATNTATTVRADLYQSLVLPAPSGSLQDFQLLTGPGMTAARPVAVTLAGSVFFDGLATNGAYTFRVRNRNGVGSSAWKTFAFRTAAAFGTRSPSPTNLVVLSSTATTITLDWTPPVGTPSGSWSYVYYINGVFKGSTTPTGPYTGLTEAERSIITIPRPAAGTSIVFGTAARDASLNTSLPTELEIVSP